MNFYYGIVENRNDPLRLGRCQVRVVALHTHDKNLLPTSELPWSTPLQPVTSAAMNGIGTSPIGPVEGTAVIIIFADSDQQQPIMMGTLGGIPSIPKTPEADDSGPILDPVAASASKEYRTIPGPVTGVQLTLFDKDNTNNTDITSNLKPNMRVFGFNIPSETYIVSIDSSTKITISNQISNYEENIITFEDPPTNIDAVIQSNVDKLRNISTDKAGNILSSSEVAAGAETSSAIKSTPANVSIPTIPPPKSTSNVSKSTAGIKALIAACDKVGLTTKEQKCALLGIAGGESKWIPQLEAFNYSPSRLKQIYSFATDDDVAKYSEATKKGITREQFFAWAYGPTKRGKGFLGNLTDADGGKYFGRGFIQLTGRGNYARYQKLANAMGLNIDIINNPDSLDADLDVSALVAALYIKDRTSKGVGTTDNPGYFYAAKKGVGVNSPDITAAKLGYYEYFYGKAVGGSAQKDAGSPIAEPPADDGPVTPQPSANSIKTGSVDTGFRDPNNKYPLAGYIGEPDTNRLARGIIDGTIVENKDKNRRLTVTKALGEGSWDQPLSTYGAKYPFNKVLETEAGHIQEFDDTPGYERIHTYHRSGTFSEIDPNGTQINYIAGDNFLIMERNGCISIAGECNITIEGNANILAKSTANVEVIGNANVDVGGNGTVRIAKTLDAVVGQDINLKAVGNFNLQAQNINMQSLADMSVLVAGATKITSSGSMDLLTSGNFKADYARGDFGSGAASADVADIDLTPPEEGVPLDPGVPFLIPPERQFEENAAAETPDDYNTPEGRASAAKQSKEQGDPNAPDPSATESSETMSGGSTTTTSVDCKIIYSTKEFTNDYRLSTNFTLGMLIDGGVNGKHRLVDQMLMNTATGKEHLYTVQEIVCNLANLAQNVLEPALAVLPGGIGGFRKQWRINSGYRLRGVVPNESPTSDHCKGHCADIGILLPSKYQKTYEYAQMIEKVIPYDQLILEYRFQDSCWIHVGYKPNGSNRKMAFTMVNDKTYKRDAKGNPVGFYLLDTIPPKKSQ